MKNITRKFIIDALNELGFKSYTEIQAKVVPLMLSGQDVIGCSQTGTGKTHSFLIPTFEQLDLDKDQLQVVIATPTRELANQIYHAAVQIAGKLEQSIDIRRFVGGGDKLREVERLKKSQPQIAIGTPGKLFDLAVKERVLKMHTADRFIIDEADMTMDAGFLPHIVELYDIIQGKAQISVFSATISEQMRPFLRKIMDHPQEVFVAPRRLSNLNIEHVFVPVKSKEPKDILLQLVNTLQPYIALVFCNTKEKVDEITSFLYSQNKNVAKIHGDISPRQRKRIMQQANQAKFQFIVASDIASRGIDIDGVSHVINYELPKDMEFYIHRTGRTGRASYEGVAISLYHTNDDAYIDFLENKGISIVYKEVRNGELVVRKARKERSKRELVRGGVDKNQFNIKKNNKKVKPGYKKRYNKELQRAKTKARLRKKK